MGYTSIVVGTDGSASAAATVHHGAELAEQSGATLHIVSAYEKLSLKQRQYESRSLPPNLRIDGLGDPHVAAKAIAEDAAHVVARPGLPVTLHTVAAEPAAALCEVAKRVDASLIVVGNRGVKDWSRFVNDPVCKAVQSSAPCPVQVVDTESLWRER
jgi:nucleotide-binding universal stress UspA family protein